MANVILIRSIISQSWEENLFNYQGGKKDEEYSDDEEDEEYNNYNREKYKTYS